MRFLYWWLCYLCLCVVLALILRRYVLVFVRVQGRSMMNTLADGEFLAVRRYSRKRRPERHDIVICRFEGEKRLFLKRIIALPGEEISAEKGVVFINGEPLIEKFAKRFSVRKIAPRQLGDGEYFVMGDNRPCSKDSRALGPVRERAILGYAVYALFPFRNRRRLR